MGTLVRWVVSQAPIVYPNRLGFVGWSARFLLYTPADPGSFGWSARVPIPQPTLVHWGGQPGLLLYTPADSGLFGWSARVPNVYPNVFVPFFCFLTQLNRTNRM